MGVCEDWPGSFVEPELSAYVAWLPFPVCILGGSGGSGGWCLVEPGIGFASGAVGRAFEACALGVAPTVSLLGFNSTSGLPIGSSLVGSYETPPGANAVGGLDG